jgi:hypothetical protein
MASGFDLHFLPDPERARLYDKIYAEYQRLGAFVEAPFAARPAEPASTSR